MQACVFQQRKEKRRVGKKKQTPFVAIQVCVSKVHLNTP